MLVRYFSVGGIEASLFLGTALFCSVTVWYVKKPTIWSISCLSIAFVFLLLIRPILLPFAPFLLLGALAWGRYSGLRNEVFALAAGVLVWLGVLGWSIGSSGDARMVTGTYGSISLYCAWNPYLDLRTNYYSTKWRNVSDEGVKPLRNDKGWKQRDAVLKQKVVEFIKNDPMAALQGYLFRLGRYSISAENSAYVMTQANGYMVHAG